MPEGVEIERKFLVQRVPADLGSLSHREIDQGYLAVTDEGVEVRVRRSGAECYLTIKSGAGRVRVEEEIEIDERRFRSLWALTEGRRLTKVRYRLPLGEGVCLELDVYAGALQGLTTAEIEFGSEEEAAAFVPPDWVGREITDDARYKNHRLATAGLPG